ncbi:MAG: hypothetical protein AAF517_11410, partial [Planctomycetota bacterium]
MLRCVVCLLGCIGVAVSLRANELRLENATGAFGGTAHVPIVLSTKSQVQGLVVSIEWDDDGLSGEGFEPSKALGDADTIVSRAEDQYALFGVVMDTNPEDGTGEVIGPGNDIEVARLVLSCGSGAEEETVELTLVDNRHAFADGGPLVENLVTVGGETISSGEGLTLAGATVACVVRPTSFELRPQGGESCEDVQVVMTNNQAVEGFVVALCHESDAELQDVLPGSAASEADFVTKEIEAGGGAIGVVIDLADPLPMPPNIDPGENQHIATFEYCCSMPLAEVRFCDGVVGEPTKENLIVVAGTSITSGAGLTLGERVSVCEDSNPPVFESDCSNGIDDDGDGLIDEADPDCQDSNFAIVGGDPLDVVTVKVRRGGFSSATLGLRSPRIDEGGNQFAPLQGFSLAMSFECDQLVATEEFDITGTILEAIGTDFVGLQADNDGNDGDGCSYILSVLVEAAPPVRGDMIPGQEDWQALGTMSWGVSEDVSCGDFVLASAEDGVNGRGDVPVRNLMSIDNEPVPSIV